MRMDLEVLSHQLPPARKLSALVHDVPSPTIETSIEAGETTEVGVRLETAIPRMERHRKRRRLARRVLGIVALVALLTAAAWGTWTYAIPHTAVVPALVGEAVDAATDRLTALGFTVARAPGEHSMQIAAGHVKEITPAAGAERDVGSAITIVPSLGPPPVDVPAVRGEKLQAARRAITEAGLHVEGVRRRFDAEVPADRVIELRPGEAQLPRGSSVTVIVSDGPEPVSIPDVKGMTEEKAVRALTAKGFEVVIEEDFSRNIAGGRAIGTDPAAETELQPGETIVLRISLGPEYFDAPDFQGMTVEAARALAERVGLKLTALPVPGSGGNSIVSQLPPGGTRVRYGSTITVYYA
jgi:serine/threonine-protein kinase